MNSGLKVLKDFFFHLDLLLLKECSVLYFRNTTVLRFWEIWIFSLPETWSCEITSLSKMRERKGKLEWSLATTSDRRQKIKDLLRTFLPFSKEKKISMLYQKTVIYTNSLCSEILVWIDKWMVNNQNCNILSGPRLSNFHSIWMLTEAKIKVKNFVLDVLSFLCLNSSILFFFSQKTLYSN